MKGMLRRLRGALGLAAVWAGAGIGLGGLFELIDNVAPGAFPFIGRVDMWPQTLALFFFIAALIFAGLLAIGERHRRFDELSLKRFAAWGALAGALLGGYGMLQGASGLFLGIMTAGSALTATGSMLVVRVVERRGRLGGARPADRPALPDAER